MSSNYIPSQPQAPVSADEAPTQVGEGAYAQPQQAGAQQSAYQQPYNGYSQSYNYSQSPEGYSQGYSYPQQNRPATNYAYNQSPYPATGYVANTPTQGYFEPQWNLFAILSVVFLFVFMPASLVLGGLALSEIKKTGERGKALAIASICVSGFFVVLLALVLLVWSFFWMVAL